jgi:ATP-dependent DNA ligase
MRSDKKKLKSHSQKVVARGGIEPPTGITSSVMKWCEWVEPVLVAQVKFTEWTLDDQLRQPVFLGLRTDKEAKDVVRE